MRIPFSFRRRTSPRGKVTKAASAQGDGAQPWRVAGAAVRGTSHGRLGLPCQDAVDFRVLPGGLLVALADGAGSALRSEQGARWAAVEALAALETGLKRSPPCSHEDWVQLLRRAFARSKEAVQRLAVLDGEPVGEFASTLTCAAALDGWLAVGQIGDGVVVAREAGGTLFAATHLQKGEYANETNFLTQPDALDCVEIHVFELPVDAIAVMSDGLIRLAMQLPGGAPHRPFFEPLFTFAQATRDEFAAGVGLASFLASERVCSRTDDDKSLVIAARRLVGRAERAEGQVVP